MIEYRATFMLLLAGLFVLSFNALDKTFIKTEIIVLPALFGGVLGTVILKKLWKKHSLPFWIILLYGMLAGASVPVFLVSVTNYIFRDSKTFYTELDIVRTGYAGRQRSGCKTPYAIVVYRDIEKKFVFDCGYENNISKYKKLRLQLSKGLLGFYVIQKEGLVP